MNLNEYVGLYFFSAVFQGNMALLALLAVFAVFKRQEITSELQGKGDEIVKFVQNLLDRLDPTGKPVPFLYPKVEKIPDLLLRESKDESRPLYIRERLGAFALDPNLKARYVELEVIKNKRPETLRQMKTPFCWILAVIGVSLILLPFIDWIHSKSQCLEVLLFAVTIILNIWALLKTKRFVWKMLKTEPD